MKVVICGDGNGGHVFCCVARQQPDVEVCIFSLFAPVREKWKAAIENGNTLEVKCNNTDGTTTTIRGNPHMITDNAEEAMCGANLIVFMVPAFTHFDFLAHLEPYIVPGMTIIALPGQTGFEYAARRILKEKRKDVNLIGFNSLPWACQMSEIGTSAAIFGFKEVLNGGPLQMSASKESTETAVANLQQCLGPLPVLNVHYFTCGISLNTPNLIAHPSLFYGMWYNWDKKPVTEKPKFYWDATEKGIEIMGNVSNEVQAVNRALQHACPEFNIASFPTIHQWLQNTYKDIGDKTSLYTTIRSNKAHEPIYHPMKSVEGGYVPDFTARYLTEDIPFGMVPVKGMAELLGVPTPAMDEIIIWSQEILGKEYLVDGVLKGNNLNETSCPQSCGVTTVPQLFQC